MKVILYNRDDKVVSTDERGAGPVSLDAFGSILGITLHIRERLHPAVGTKFCVYCEEIEAVDRTCVGEGFSVYSAMQDYAKKISGRQLTITREGPEKPFTVQAPILFHGDPPESKDNIVVAEFHPPAATSIRVGRLVSGPGYSNRKAEVEVAINDGSFADARSMAEALLSEALDEPPATRRLKNIADGLRKVADRLDGDKPTPFDDDDIPF